MFSEFGTVSRIILGEGSIHQLGQVADELGQRAIVVTGSQGRHLPIVSELLNEAKISFLDFSVSGEPTVEIVQKALEKTRESSSDMVIGIGGGSALDTAKATAILMTNPGDIFDYLEVIGRGKKLIAPAIPFIAIPTTAGTGTEVTRNAVIGSPRDKVKVSLRSSLMLARVAIIDPELTYDLPGEVVASSGLDALTQLIEPYVCNNPNPIVDALCENGIMRIANNLLNSYQQISNIISKNNLIYASLFGGFALANAKLGAVHGFAGPIGGMFNASHGLVCASLLPHVIETNIATLVEISNDHPTLERYRQISRIVLHEADLSRLVEWVFRLCEELKVPKLSSFGITEDDFPEIIEKSSRSSSMKGNPVSLSSARMERILASAL